MRPVEFEGHNVILKKPDSMTDAECAPLPVATDNKRCVSVWKGDWRERLAFFLTGHMCVHVISAPQPPIAFEMGPLTPMTTWYVRKWWGWKKVITKDIKFRDIFCIMRSNGSFLKCSSIVSTQVFEASEDAKPCPPPDDNYVAKYHPRELGPPFILNALIRRFVYGDKS